MTPTKWTWAVLASLYLAFFSWYTSFEGPLREDEIEHYLSLIRANAGPQDSERLQIMREFMESDTGDDFVMWNVIDLHETPLRVEGVGPGESSSDVLARYMEYMLPAMLKRASHPVVLGQAAGAAPEMFGMEGVRRWDQGAGVRYRSRRDMMEIATDPAFRGSHAFKVAAIEKTFAFPVDPWIQLGDPRFVLALLFLVIGLGVTALRTR